MSPKLPVVSGKEAARVAQKLGFEFRRQSGSHVVYVRKRMVRGWSSPFTRALP
ncbi:MAG: type II toxin-antitoxin system HicA family toxin [Terriglobales bacterium]